MPLDSHIYVKHFFFHTLLKKQDIPAAQKHYRWAWILVAVAVLAILVSVAVVLEQQLYVRRKEKDRWRASIPHSYALSGHSNDSPESPPYEMTTTKASLTPVLNTEEQYQPELHAST